jgi:hypothetical protein
MAGKMDHEERAFRDLISEEIRRQKQSYRRATVLVVLVVLIGGAWLAFSATKVIKLEHRGATLKVEAGELQQKSTELQQQIEKQTAELEKKKRELENAEQALLDVQKKLKEGRPQEALKLVSDAIQKRGAQLGNETLGFVSELRYEGPDKTRISVEVIPDKSVPGSRQRPKSQFTYELDGRNYFSPPLEDKISFSLDKTIGDSRKLVLFLEFPDSGPRGYTIKASASAGRERSKNFHVTPPTTGVGKILTFVFSIK